MYYDPEKLKEMSDKIDLLEYASRTMQFRRIGNDYATHCPLHVDKTPSLFITPGKNVFYCHSCHKGGSVLQWMLTFEKISFPAAVKKMEEISGIQAGDSGSVSETLKVFNQYKHYNQQKPDKNPAVERQILPPNTMEKYASEFPQEWLDEGITPESMTKYEIRIDKLANRIVYPVYDRDSNLIGVKGRTRYPNYKELRLQKYINYYKIQSLDYFTGMKWALPYIRSSGEIIVVEGIKSVMKIDGWGYHNVVSAETSDINPAQFVILLQLHVRDVVLAFDKDVQMNRIRAIASKLKKYTNVQAVYDVFNLLDEKMSPCDKGKEVWDTLYRNRKRL